MRLFCADVVIAGLRYFCALKSRNRRKSCRFLLTSKKIFKLDTDETSYLIGIGPEGRLGHIYYGAGLTAAGGSYVLRMDEFPYSPDVDPKEKVSFLGYYPFEYPTGGVGDFRPSCVEISNALGQRGCELFYDSNVIESGKPSLAGLPCSFAGDDDAVETLRIHLKDTALNLAVTLLYSVFPHENILTRSVIVANSGSAEGGESFSIKRVLSACLDFDQDSQNEYEMITLPGAWARERHTERFRIHRGNQSAGSLRGVSSAQYQPFVAIAHRNTDEEHGEAVGMSFVYSGNFLVEAEWSQMNQIRVVMGIHPDGFSWELGPGESFTAPEVVFSYSADGLGKMTRQFHDFFRSHLIRSPYLRRDRPVLINNWEATYFDFDTAKLLQLAKAAKNVGIEMFVMDDGWFGERKDDLRSLGDWFVNENKLPGGLPYLVGEVNRLGMKFGIWIEPEMISPDSDLFRAHPDWALQINGRAPSYERMQLVLDITREEMRNYIMERIFGILHSANIEYVKWDMNRALTDAGNFLLPPGRQGELHHRYVLALYDMQERLVTEFPDILLENCSSGGARFDAGELYYSPQIWTSDDTDAIERLRIQQGTAMVFPLSTMGAHVSRCPNEQVGRNTAFKTRGDVALSGTFGYELDIVRLSSEELSMIPGQVEDYHRFHQIIANGDYYRLCSWTDQDPYDVWMSAAKDGSEALVTCVQVLGRPNYRSRIVKLRGLDPKAVYVLERDGEEEGELTGEELMQCGLRFASRGDFMSTRVYLRKIEKAESVELNS